MTEIIENVAIFEGTPVIPLVDRIWDLRMTNRGERSPKHTYHSFTEQADAPFDLAHFVPRWWPVEIRDDDALADNRVICER